MESDRLVYTVAEAAALLGLSRNAAYAGCRTGQIPCLRIGKRLLVPQVQLERLLREGGYETALD